MNDNEFELINSLSINQIIAKLRMNIDNTNLLIAILEQKMLEHKKQKKLGEYLNNET